MTRARALVAIAALACGGWDTTVDEAAERPWVAAYLGVDDATLANLRGADGAIDPDALAHNEHRELAALAMLELGWRGLFLQPIPRIVDLNASIYRPEVRAIVPPIDDGDDAATPLVERWLPHPARFAGLPDYAYAVHDWINRTSLCPALPPDAPERDACYVYATWHGAALNSTHFGDQAREMYEHYHRIAMHLAITAGLLGTQARLGGAGDAEELRRYARAAELEALAFEAVAQHYLQDRWSSGHTWNRWNGPTYAAQAGTLDDSISVGLIAGITHGAESVLRSVPGGTAKDPDPICSPVIAGDEARPASVLHGGAPVPMVGDHRLEDALDGGFGEEYGYPDLALDVEGQLRDLLACSKAGWADVARRFDRDGDVTTGLGLPVPGATPTFGGGDDVSAATADGRTVPCWDGWATNDTMYTGISTLGQGRLWSSLVGVGRAMFRVADPRAVAPQAFKHLRLDWRALARVTKAFRLAATRDPNGTTLARGEALPTVQRAAPGQTYLAQHVPPDYADAYELGTGEYGPFSGLPEHADAWGSPSLTDRPGRDKHALYGFFHEAHVDWWCRNAEELLTPVPGLPLDDPDQGLRWPTPLPQGGGTGPSAEEAEELQRRLDACVIVADRLFAGTRAWYRDTAYVGEQEEVRRIGHGDESASTAAPVCEVLGLADGWDDDPRDLHPGYVSASTGPYATVEHYGETVYASAVAWCKALPVIHVDDDDRAVDALGDPIVVTPGYDDAGALSFDPADLDPEVTIHGLHFGDEEGRLELEGRGCVDELAVSPYPEIVAWSDTSITFRLDQTRFPPDLYDLTVIRADRDADARAVRSIGRFRLDVRKAAYTGLGAPGGPLPTDVTGQTFRSIHPFCDGGDVLHHQLVDCTDAGDLQACGSGAGGGQVLWTGPAPMFEYLPGPYPEHQYGVIATGVCGALPFPAACPTGADSGVHVWYGAVHRLERTSEAPIGTQPPRQWRYTLAWQRRGPIP